ncbi:MAG TPA: hypothetical protein PKD34_01935 [Candidatus Doudnabacteria bacterium]|nr:hypothetical protein [Candidatus Doudnabacteria bacterium]
MKQLISNIRNKPQHHKNRIIIITLIGVVAFMLVLWAVVGMPPREGTSGDVIFEFNETVEETQNVLPNLFPNSNEQ